ncbi:hypothetical protein [Chryseolinea lacunae]|uniref:Uncharacterized protein n=1 Tax=Chryseolinea lacunae TaxID=2801331 RepID=A0ABS1KZN7_9BACT|nr:hypothetical protein [Chryseolinea lacunae]MBL0744915.1 hypothetical protein [Chryseolinea lacunae]
MGKDSNIVHQYFRKEFEGMTILVKVNPILWKGTELTLLPSGAVERRDLDFDAEVLEDLKVDGFEDGSALEFNLYLSGLAG